VRDAGAACRAAAADCSVVEQGTVSSTLKQYSAVFLTSLLIVKKYMISESGLYAKHARVLDPNRRLNMTRVIGDYTATFGTVAKDPEMQEEWSAYWDLPSARAEKESLDVWWEKHGDRLPKLYHLAKKVLYEDRSTVDVEASFSTLKLSKSILQR
jgi:hypothetical protein